MTRARWMTVPVVAALTCISAGAQADDKECMAAASKGQELRDEGKLTEARTLFERCADPSCPAPIPGYCAEWLGDVARKMPTVVFRAVDETGHDVTDASAQIDGSAPVAVDGRAVDVNPGKRTIRISRAGSRPFEDVIVVAQGEKDRVVVAKLAPAPIAATPVETPAPVKTSRGVPTASWVAWGIGGAALLSFAAFGLKARVDYDDYESRCGSRCAPSERDTVQTSVTIADVSLVVALLAAGVGTVFYLVRPTPSSAEARR